MTFDTKAELTNLLDALLEAIRFASIMHTDQTDKNGEPFIGHPLRVMALLPDDLDGWPGYGPHPGGYDPAVYAIVAVLHDVVEDTPATLEDIAVRWGWTIHDAVDAITRRDGETWRAYLERVRENPIARVVKVADMTDNSDLRRTRTSELRSMAIERYAPGIEYLRTRART